MERKYSVIIPTMYKCKDILVQLLSSLEEDSSVSEIIVIENSKSTDYSINVFSKVKTLPQIKNIYVNPSWNLGVEESKENHVAILNDDIIIPNNLFSHLNKFDIDSLGIIGACDFLIQETDTPKRFNVRYTHIATISERLWGYGVLMIMNKQNYHQIPEDLLIWAGDDYVFHKNVSMGKVNGMLLCPIQTRMSTTSNNKEYDEIKQKDAETYEKVYKPYFIQ
jgi:GT2 family glycosyltransferase